MLTDTSTLDPPHESSMPDDREDFDRDIKIPAAYRLDRNLAVLTSEFQNFKLDFEKRFDRLEQNFREAQTSFATKTDLEKTNKELAELRSSIGWFVKSVLFIVIVAVMGLVVSKTGLPHP